jgi:hypothetical protein
VKEEDRHITWCHQNLRIFPKDGEQVFKDNLVETVRLNYIYLIISEEEKTKFRVLVKRLSD